nr:secrectory protein [Plasmodiophora brassicae]
MATGNPTCFALSPLILLALTTGLTDAVQLVSKSGERVHVPNLAAAAHSGVISRMMEDVCLDDVSIRLEVSIDVLHHVRNYIITFGEQPVNPDVEGAAWVMDRFQTNVWDEAKNQVAVGADFLEMKTLLASIAATLHSWENIDAMRTKFSSAQERHEAALSSVRQIARGDEGNEEIAKQVFRVACFGGNVNRINNRAWAIRPYRQVRHDFFDLPPDASSPSSGNILHQTAYEGEEAVVAALLDLPGINVNARDSLGRTPLHYAARHGHEEVVKMLLNAPGVDITAADNSNESPLVWAQQGGHSTIVEQLEAKLARP